MADFFMRKAANNHLVPSEQDAHSYVRNLKIGEDVRVTVTKPRNILFHRKFFALLRAAHENQEKYDDFEAFRHEVTLRSGFWTEHVHISGKISYLPKSIAFHEMCELEFNQLYSKAIDVILEHFLPGTTAEELDREAMKILDFAA